MSSDALAAKLIDTLRPAYTGSARPLIVGICGAQGSGKSTLADAMNRQLSREGAVSAVLSLDDLYLRWQDRLALARMVHPLLATRGVPGTHDIPLARSLFRDLRLGYPARLPRFDKAIDDRCPPNGFEPITAPLDVLLFEGWCLGARPQPAASLIEPQNALEREEDPDGRWRRYVNRQLAGDYAELFGVIDRLVMLAAPDFDIVARWREEQEAQLRIRSGAGMSPQEVQRFIRFYERITRYILKEMPDRADILVSLASDRSVREISFGSA